MPVNDAPAMDEHADTHNGIEIVTILSTAAPASSFPKSSLSSRFGKRWVDGKRQLESAAVKHEITKAQT